MALPRVQLFEFNDQAWVPTALRDIVVEALSRTLDWGRMLRGLVAPLSEFLEATGAREVLDLGAGAGGPVKILVRELRRAGRPIPTFMLTDLHPRVRAWEHIRGEFPGLVDFVPESVDATAIPPSVAEGRVRTIINVFHHFPPALARSILTDAVRGSKGVFIAEGFPRNPLQFANFAPMGLAALAATPFLSPRDRLQKILWTYATPVLLPISLWDGLVSTLRVYTPSELRAMVADLDPTWRWESGTFKYPPLGTGTWFYGVPGGR